MKTRGTKTRDFCVRGEPSNECENVTPASETLAIEFSTIGTPAEDDGLSDVQAFVRTSNCVAKADRSGCDRMIVLRKIL